MAAIYWVAENVTSKPAAGDDSRIDKDFYAITEYNHTGDEAASEKGDPGPRRPRKPQSMLPVTAVLSKADPGLGNPSNLTLFLACSITTGITAGSNEK